MKRKIFSILFALVLVLSFSLVTAVPVAADTITVGAGETYDTIGAAITAAGPGDTINVAAGTYNEKLVIDKQLTLLGAQYEVDPTVAGVRTDEAEESVIDATGSEFGITIMAGSVTVDGFTVTGATGSGIQINEYGGAEIAGGNTVTNNILSDNGSRGLQQWKSDNNTIANNLMSNNGRGGVTIWYSDDNTIASNVMTGNGAGSGLFLDHGDNNTIENNVIFLNVGQDDGHGGIRVGNSCGNTITGNTLSGQYQGITMRYETHNNIITNNTIEDNKKGISLWHTPSGNEAHHNNIVGNTEYGVYNDSGVEFDATLNWWGATNGPAPSGSGDAVSDNVLYDPWLKAPYRPTTSMSSFTIDHAKIDFKKKVDDDKIRVQGKLELDLVNGDGVAISEAVTVTVGPRSETITMVEKGKKGDRWHYQRPKRDEGNIKHMTINWKNGKFDIRMDKADLSELTDPEVTISIQIGDDVGEETITMREKKHHWDYKAK